jgi:hypothetical protein
MKGEWKMSRVGESGRGAEVMGGRQRWVASRQGGGGVPCSPALKYDGWPVSPLQVLPSLPFTLLLLLSSPRTSDHTMHIASEPLPSLLSDPHRYFR